MTNMRLKMPPEARRAMIISDALDIATRVGLDKATPKAVARYSGVPFGTIRYYFDTMGLWRAVVGDPRATDAIRKQGERLGLR